MRTTKEGEERRRRGEGNSVRGVECFLLLLHVRRSRPLRVELRLPHGRGFSFLCAVCSICRCLAGETFPNVVLPWWLCHVSCGLCVCIACSLWEWSCDCDMVAIVFSLCTCY